MKVGGQYIGLGFGDSSNEIRAIKDFMRRKFSYARSLADTTLYDEQMVTAVVEMQTRYNKSGQLASGKYTLGVINAETKYVMGYLKRPTVDNRGVLLTVSGTSVPWWVGPDADTARAVEDKYLWRPVGYPAQPFPMAPSIAAGRAEGNRIVNEERGRIEAHGLSLGGYSQGAVVIAEMWEYDIKPATGPLHWVLPYMRKAVTWGNPMREQGKAYPDPGGALADIDSHGVTGNLMVDTPDWWRNYAHHGDLYTECSGQSGEMKTAIWQVIRGTKVFAGPDSILAQVLEITQSPVVETIAMFKAMIDAGMFFASGTGPHVNYSPQPAIDYLRAA